MYERKRGMFFLLFYFLFYFSFLEEGKTKKTFFFLAGPSKTAWKFLGILKTDTDKNKDVGIGSLFQPRWRKVLAAGLMAFLLQPSRRTVELWRLL